MSQDPHREQPAMRLARPRVLARTRERGRERGREREREGERELVTHPPTHPPSFVLPCSPRQPNYDILDLGLSCNPQALQWSKLPAVQARTSQFCPHAPTHTDTTAQELDE